MKGRKLLDTLLREITNLIGETNNREDATKAGKEHYYQLDHNSIYGGYRIDRVRVSGGGTSGAFGQSGTEPRLSAKLMELKLRSLIAGIETGIEISKSK